MNDRVIQAFVPDLMDRSKVSAAARRAAATIHFVTAADGLDGAADLVLVDLSRPGALDAAARCTATTVVVGFAPHVDDDLLGAATALGVEACARSVFFRRLDELLPA